jgi:F-type H+-transporting ATPase subunit a
MADRTNNLQKMSFAALAAESLFHVGNFPVTNSMLNAWIVAGIFIIIAFIASRRKSLVPRGIHNVFEAIVEFLLGEMEKVTNDAKKARAFFPFVATIFLFILANNWLGLLPGTGTIGFTEMVHGEAEFIPLLRPAAADLNFTLAIALLSLIVVQFAGIKSTGLVNYASKFINIRGIFRAIPKGPVAVLVAIIEFFVGLLEIISEFAKVLSLSLRLFGNVFAGEILMGVMLSLVSVFLPIPFIFLEILVGVIQATVFAMLVLVFLTVATTGHDDHGDDHAPEHEKEKAHA